MILKLSLLNSTKEIVFFSLFIFVIFLSNLSLEYKNFKQIKENSYYKDSFVVLNQYTKQRKNKRIYFVLKLSNSNFTFFTTTYLPLPNLMNKNIKLILNTEQTTFLEYLRGFYAYSFNYELVDNKDNFKDYLIKKISNSHQNDITKEIFLAIFLAIPLSQNLRDKINLFGIAHLIAISGYHLGVISSILYFLLKPIYGFFHNNYFPYRNKKIDLSIIIFIILFFYMILTNFPPSIIRAFVMMIIIFYLYCKNFKLLSFKTLLITIILILAFLPKLFFSISFWLSVAGVFYIYLFLHHFKNLNKILIFILIYFWVFFLMLPISYFLFEKFSFYQLYSPIISMFFILFYPFEIFLHITGYGDLLDNLIIKFFSSKPNFIELKIPLNFLILYITTSILAIRYKILIICLFVYLPLYYLIWYN